VPLLPECVLDVGEVRVVARQRGLSVVQRRLENREYEWARVTLERERVERANLPFTMMVVHAPTHVHDANPSLARASPLRRLEPAKPHRIGRSRLCSIYVESDDVAKEHAALDVDANGVWVTRLGKPHVYLGARGLETGVKTAWDWKDLLRIG